MAFRPVALPAFEGFPPPPGYEEVSRPNRTLMWAGGITFALSYGSSVGFGAANGFEQGLGLTALPILGPWIAIGQRDFDCEITVSTSAAEECQRRTLSEATTVAVLAGLGVGQLVGATVLTVGLLDRQHYWVRSDLLSLKFDATVTPGGGRFWLRGTF